MIENKLTFDELSRLIGPFLRMQRPGIILSKLQSIFLAPEAEIKDILCQQRVLVSYRGCQIDITDMREDIGSGLYVHMQFKVKKKWWHCFRDTSRAVIQDLQRICVAEITNLRFSRFVVDSAFDMLRQINREVKLTYYHDSEAFNPNWSYGRSISPLLIALDEHDEHLFVEFFFNPVAYLRRDKSTVLREDWQTRFVEGVPRDPAKTLTANLQKAEKGSSIAAYTLAKMYLNGEGTAKDCSEARSWLIKAAEKGHAAAMTDLGRIYYVGDEGPKDLSEAAKWTQRAVAKGSPAAMHNLAILYCKGLGVPSDKVQALMWYEISVSKGCEEDRALKDAIEQNMTQGQLASARQSATQYIVEEWQ